MRHITVRTKRVIQASFNFGITLMLVAMPLAVLPATAASAMPAITEYPLPVLNGNDPQPIGMVAGPDGALWFTEPNSNFNAIGRIDTSGTITSYPLPTSRAFPYNITTGPDGALWFTELTADNIGRITTTGDITTFPLPSSIVWPQGITTGPDGALWFTAYFNDGNQTPAIGRLSTSGSVSLFTVPGIVPLESITTGPDGALWFTTASDNYVPGTIGRITTSGDVTEYPVSGIAGTQGIIAGPDGALWFTVAGVNGAPDSIGRITTAGVMTQYQLDAIYDTPAGITVGPDGALWFTESGGNKIGRITTSGDITEYPVPTANSQPFGIATGSDGNMWFTEASLFAGLVNIGRVNLVAVPAPAAPTNLAAASPTNGAPALSWSAVSTATSYNIYRDGTKIDSTTDASYIDNSAPEGAHSYYVTAVNESGESDGSNTISVSVDRTAPTLGMPIWTANPIQVGANSTLNVPASDNLSGVAGGEYFVGTDPGAGNGTAMNYTNGNLTATLGANLGVGVYIIGTRAKDAAGNWSGITTTMLVVTDSGTTLSMTGKNKKDLVPSLVNGDVMPGLISSTQTDAADYGITVQYKNGSLDPRNDFHLMYSTGSNCGKNNASNCHSFSLDASSFSWLVINGTNNSNGEFQGVANVTVDGATTTNPFTISGTDGNSLSPASNDYLQLKVYAPGADPSTATPIYQISGFMAKGTSVVIK